MVKKKVSTKSKRRLLVFGTMSIFIVLYFFYTVISSGAKLINLQNQEREINEKLLVLQEEEELLKTEIEMLQDPEYIARYARENYLYSKDGEYIIKIDEKEKIDEHIVTEDYSGLIIGSGVVGGFIVLYLITKTKRKN